MDKRVKILYSLFLFKSKLQLKNDLTFEEEKILFKLRECFKKESQKGEIKNIVREIQTSLENTPLRSRLVSKGETLRLVAQKTDIRNMGRAVAFVMFAGTFFRMQETPEEEEVVHRETLKIIKELGLEDKPGWLPTWPTIFQMTLRFFGFN